MAQYCRDDFIMTEDNGDSFQMWQGLVGPYFLPSVNENGVISWSNNGGLPNPEPQNIRGPQGPGVPEGGSAGQFYRKASATDYDGEWHTLSAGDSSYDSSLTYSSGTVGQELSSQRNTLNQLNTETTTIEQSIAIIINGATASVNVSKGQYVFVKGSTISGAADGLYTYNAVTQKSAGVSFVSSELTPVTSGGLNSLAIKQDQFTGTVDAYNGIPTTIKTYDRIIVACYEDNGYVVVPGIYAPANEWRFQLGTSTAFPSAPQGQTMTITYYYVNA